MSDHEVFRTTLMGGYDKEDVIEQFRIRKDAAAAEKSRLLKELEVKDAQILELKDQLAQKDVQLGEKDAQRAKLEKDVSDKYQKYVDHFESISRLLVESQIKADETISQAEREKERILGEAAAEATRRVSEAEAEATRRVDAVQQEIDEKLADGKRRYVEVQEEMNEIVELINQAQKRFMASYKEVHRIVSAMPESLQEFEE